MKQSLSGHAAIERRTTHVVNRHYWRPHREQIRQAFTENMAGLLCTGMASWTDLP